MRFYYVFFVDALHHGALTIEQVVAPVDKPGTSVHITPERASIGKVLCTQFGSFTQPRNFVNVFYLMFFSEISTAYQNC